MISVIKLKAQVDNRDLPVLTNDGDITNYYVGQYKNKLLELGYTLTTRQMEAVEAFIEDGINKGWINHIKYFLPFIGNNTIPLAGAVPLIDEIDNYQMSSYTMNEDLSKIFLYDNAGNIISMGGATVTPNDQVLKTPIKLSDMNKGVNLSVSFAPFVRDNTDLSYFACMLKDGKVIRAVRMNSTSSRFEIATRQNINDSNPVLINVFAPFGEQMDQLFLNREAFNLNINYYQDETGNVNYMRYVISANKTINNYDTGLSTSFVIGDTTDANTGTFNANFGQNNYTNLIPIRTWAVFNPNIPRTALTDFNSAVFNLNIALGRTDN